MTRRQHLELGAIVKAIIDTNLYMTLGTADEDGRPWVSPVYYASEGYAVFYWVSSPEATHSRNLAARPEVCIGVFEPRVPVGSGQEYTYRPSRRSSRAPTSAKASRFSPAGPKRTGPASGRKMTYCLPLPPLVPGHRYRALRARRADRRTLVSV
jgi:hypothetical protein